MKRRNFFRTLGAGIAGLAVAKSLPAEPEVEQFEQAGGIPLPDDYVRTYRIKISKEDFYKKYPVTYEEAWITTQTEWEGEKWTITELKSFANK